MIKLGHFEDFFLHFFDLQKHASQVSKNTGGGGRGNSDNVQIQADFLRDGFPILPEVFLLVHFGLYF